MNLDGLMVKLQQKIESGDTSEKNIEDVLLKIGKIAIDEYMLGNSELSRLMQVLIEEKLTDKHDPMLADMSMMNRMGMWATLNLLKKTREQVNVQRNEAEQAEIQRRAVEGHKAETSQLPGLPTSEST